FAAGARDARGGVPGAVRVAAIVNRDLEPILCEPSRDRGADALARARDQDRARHAFLIAGWRVAISSGDGRYVVTMAVATMRASAGRSWIAIENLHTATQRS